MAWAKNGTPDTLGSSGDVLTISDLTAMKFNMLMEYDIKVTNSIRTIITTDNNTATDYAKRQSVNGAADATSTSQTGISGFNGSGNDQFSITYFVNIDSEEKLMIKNEINQGTVGAAAAPNRTEQVGKVDTTTNSGQFTRVDSTNDQAGDLDTDSNLSVLGTD